MSQTIQQKAGAVDCYLIEAPGQAYPSARLLCNCYEFHWTNDANKALRFVDHSGADLAMMAIRRLMPDLFPSAFLWAPKPVGHSWADLSDLQRTEGGT